MASITLTASQFKLLGAVVETQSAEVNWNVVAETAGLDSSKKARENWPTIKKKVVGTTEEKTIVVDLTEAQQSLLNAVIGTKIDFKGACEKAGLGTAKKARENYATIKKKLSATGETGAKTTTKGKKRKADEADTAAEGDVAANGDADTEAAAPTKKAKTTTKKEPVAKKETVKKPAAAKKPAAKGKKGKKADTPVEDEAEPEPASEEVVYEADGVEIQEEPFQSIFGEGVQA